MREEEDVGEKEEEEEEEENIQEWNTKLGGRCDEGLVVIISAWWGKIRHLS